MSLIKLENAARQFRSEPIWQDINLTLEPGERLGIIGANGSGKSTLLRVMADLDAPDYGSVAFKTDLTKGFLPQNPYFEPQLSVREAVEQSQREIADLMTAYEQACLNYQHEPSAANGQKMEGLAAVLNSRQAWTLPQRTEAMLSQLSLDGTDLPVGKLSQGMRKKLAIGIALLNNPEVLFLDEPTNHLDTVTVDWLEAQLNLFKGAIVLVTHDRYFLDKLAERILELDRGRAKIYAGNYASYLEQKEHDLQLSCAEDEKRQNLLRREMAWFKRGARARSTKQKARQERLLQLIDYHKEQHSLLNQSADVSMNSLRTSKRLGNKGVNLYGISKSYGERTLIKDFSLKIGKGDRLGFVGPNGCGKSTLLNIITERLLPDSGHIEFGETVRLGLYSQTAQDANTDLTILDYVREGGDYISAPDGRRISAENLLEQFLFPRRIQHDRIGKLSGGERNRLRLLRLLMESPNCLLLDEPTNDLDIPTLVRLEAWLDDFPGIVVIVSHDRYFLDRCADRLFYFENGRIQEFIGDYETLRQHINASARLQNQALREQSPRSRGTETAASPKTDGKEAVKPAPTPKKKLTYKQKTRLAQLESLIAEKEKRQSDLQQIISSPSGHENELMQICREFDALQNELEELFAEWEELAALAEP
ncbi:ABC-F family ATP-binding cassette domain-containing protein [bacterium]|nr:ABC-F family ATP-binding cassette domain-containing protein [bacterium]